MKPYPSYSKQVEGTAQPSANFRLLRDATDQELRAELRKRRREAPMRKMLKELQETRDKVQAQIDSINRSLSEGK